MSTAEEIADAMLKLVPVSFKQRDECAEQIDRCSCLAKDCAGCRQARKLVHALEDELAKRFPGYTPPPRHPPKQLSLDTGGSSGSRR